ANYLPDDLFRNLRIGHTKPSAIANEIIADAEKINEGQLFESYARYLSIHNCLFLLTHIKFINYGRDLISLADIAKLYQTSKLNVQQLPHFVTWRLKNEEQAIISHSEYIEQLTDPKNEFEQKLLTYTYCSWRINSESAFKNAPNWAL